MAHLSLDGVLSSLLTLDDELLRLDGEVKTTSLALGETESSVGKVLELLETSLILLLDLSESKDSSLLLVDEVTETSLTLDDDEGDVHLAAEGGEPDGELEGVDIVSNDDELSLLGLNEGGDVIKTILDDLGLGGGSSLLAIDLVGSSSLEAGSLLLAGLGLVLAEELEEGGSLILSKGLGELVNSSRNLDALLEDSALTLDADIEGELSETAKIDLLRREGTTDGSLLGSLLEKVGVRILPLFNGLKRTTKTVKKSQVKLNQQ